MSGPSTSSAATRVAPSPGQLNHPAKAIYFATGSPQLALADIERLGLTANGTALRVVSPAAGCERLRANAVLKKAGVIAYSHGRAVWVWLRLMAFLGFTRNTELICLNTPQNYRLMKLLAFSLRGRGRFSTGRTQTPSVSILGMLRLSWHNYLIRREQRINEMPVLVIGSGSARTMRLIAARLRERYPRERLVAWLPASIAKSLESTFDEMRVFPQGFGSCVPAALRLLREGRKFKAAVIPCTNEFDRWMKLTTLLVPLREKKIYNEVGDGFDLEQARSGFRHLQWRFLRTDRKLAWPVAVIGSASGYYLEKIVASLRKSFPGSEIHGWLGPLQSASVGHLFDVVHTLPGTGPSLRTIFGVLARGRMYRCWIVPCTDEPFRWLKWLAFCLPLRRRMLYNETGDGFPLRSVATVWEHVCWRLRHKFTFQFLSGSSDSPLLHRLIHVPAYALRLALATPLLLRATRRRRHPRDPEVKRVTMIVLGSARSEAILRATEHENPNGVVTTVEKIDPEADIVNALFRSAESGTADFICLCDGECRVSAGGWLEQLLKPFDDTVAQVGPELTFDGTSNVYQGAFFDTQGGTFWNTNSAARFHAREQWLEVAALPAFCLVVRREALLSIASDYRRTREHSGCHPKDTMSELGHLFAINGWKSICNTEVSAFYPLETRSQQLHLSAAT